MKVFDKLVRDNIPEIIKKNGGIAKFHIADDKEFELKLFEKLREEVNELISSPSIDEAADILEVFRSVCKLKGWELEDVETKRLEKCQDRGGFEERIILEYTK